MVGQSLSSVVQSQTTLAVVRIQFGNPSIIDLYMDPQVGEPVPTQPDVEITYANPISIDEMVLQGGGIGPQEVTIDEARIGPSFESVTPMSQNPPEVALTSPRDNSSFDGGVAFVIAADASEVGGSIASVQFVANGQVLDTVTSAPYQFSWSGAVNGRYILTAIATDTFGTTSQSQPVYVTIAPQLPLAYDPTQISNGTMPLHDTFSGYGWNTNWSVQNNDYTIPGYDILASSPLSYLNLVSTPDYAVGGNVWLTAGRGLDVGGPFATFATGASSMVGSSPSTIWMSVLMRADASPIDDAWLCLHRSGIVWDAYASPALAVGYFEGSNPQSPTATWSLRLGSAQYLTSSVPVSVGQSTLMVAEIIYGSGTTTVNVFIDPTQLGGASPTAAPDITCTTDADVTFQSCAFYAGYTHGLSSIDEIRFGSSFASVTPVQLAPVQGLFLHIPAASPVSPIYLEGTVGTGTVSATDAGVSVNVSPLTATRSYLNAALNPVEPTTIQVTCNATTVAGTVTWSPTMIVGSPSLHLRVNDSLLLESPVDGSLSILDNCGAAVPAQSVTAGQAIPYCFTNAGYYQISVTDSSGMLVGILSVTAIGEDLQGPIADQIGYARVKTTTTTPENENVWVGSNDVRWMEVSNQAATSTGLTMNLLPLAMGNCPRLLARLDDTNGPLLTVYPVNVFQLTTTAETTIGVVEEYPDGSLLCSANLLMSPLVPNIDIVVHCWVAGVTFPDSTTTMTISSNDFAADGQGGGSYAYSLLVAPGVDSHLCHSITAYQNGVQVSQ